MKKYLQFTLLALMLSGCSNTQRPEYFQDKLKSMLNINSSIGAGIGYHNKLFNGPMFSNERLYQQLNGMPDSQVTYQQFKKVRSKYGL